MTKCIVVFKSKTHTMIFIDLMNELGLYAQKVSTPKEAKIGCGLSAEILVKDKSTAINIINKRNLSSFYSILMIEKRVNRVITTKI